MMTAMGKKKTVVVLSSDDEGDRSLSTNRRRTKSKLNSTVPRTNPIRSKKARISGSRLSLREESINWDEVRLFCEDFGEDLSGFKVSIGSGRNDNNELWVDKYKPCSLDELAVHKKKVEEVKLWLEERLRTPKDEFRSNVLVVTGQAGVGKSATIHAIASHLGASVYEWNTPTPMCWSEHLHNRSRGLNYVSKLDEFEQFVERIRKYGMVLSSVDQGSESSVILLIDDLPLTHNKSAFGRLQNCLYFLVRSAQIPTVISVTNFGEADLTDQTTRYLEELNAFLESAGACKVAFNLITHNSIKKVLSRLCKQEKCDVSAEHIDLIAKASGGDIRHAITSLQYFSLKLNQMHAFSSSTSTCSEEKPDLIGMLDAGISLQFGRDETLSLFHALGKFLHNKRDSEIAMELDGNEFSMQEGLSRLPLKMDTPEKILCQAHAQARPLADFLHENALDFLSEDAIDDASIVVSYLSNADLLFSTFHGMLARHNEVENVLQSAAASVAVRGVLFGNLHPAPPRWHSIRKPKLWQIEQSSLHTKKEIAKRRYDTYDGFRSMDISVIATEYTPTFKLLECRTLRGSKTCDRVTDMLDLDDQENLNSDDEIENW